MWLVGNWFYSCISQEISRKLHFTSNARIFSISVAKRSRSGVMLLALYRVTIRRWCFGWCRARSADTDAEWWAVPWPLHTLAVYFVRWTHYYCCRSIWWPNRIVCTSATRPPIVSAANWMSLCSNVGNSYCSRCSIEHIRTHRCRGWLLPRCLHHRCNRHYSDCPHCRCCKLDRSIRPVWWSKIYSICDSIWFDWISIRWHCDRAPSMSMWLVWVSSPPHALDSMWHLESITLLCPRYHLNCLRASRFDMSPNTRDMPWKWMENIGSVTVWMCEREKWARLTCSPR